MALLRPTAESGMAQGLMYLDYGKDTAAIVSSDLSYTAERAVEILQIE
jgi:hypothetical protein